MKLRTVTLGCKVNQYETEFVREGLLGIGYATRPTTSGRAVRRQHLHGHGRGRRQEPADDSPAGPRQPGAKIVVMGCYATRAPQEVAALPGVSRWSPTSASCPICWAASA